MTEPAHLHDTRTGYDAAAVVYAERFAGGLAAAVLDRALLAAFSELARPPGTGSDAGSAAAGRAARVADVGCGPGHVTAHLRSLGLDAFGVDLSPAMVGLARQAHPDLIFDVGSMAALDLPDGTLDGIVARYSIIHTPPELVPDVFVEFHRVLAPAGHLLLAFQATDEIQTTGNPVTGNPVTGNPVTGNPVTGNPVTDDVRAADEHPAPETTTKPGASEDDEATAVTVMARETEGAHPIGDHRALAQAFDHAVAPAYRWPPARIADLLRDAGFVEIARLVREPAETERFPQATVLARRSTC